MLSIKKLKSVSRQDQQGKRNGSSAAIAQADQGETETEVINSYS